MTQPVAASLTIDPAGDNNAIVYTAVTKGIGGNGLTIEYTDGGTAASEAVTVTGPAIAIDLEDGVSTADQVKTAIEGEADADALVSVADAAANDGSGTIPAAVAATNLAGGAAGFPDNLSSPATLSNRRLAAAAVLGGWADGDVATVLTTALAAGYRNRAAVPSHSVGGIIAGVNR